MAYGLGNLHRRRTVVPGDRGLLGKFTPSGSGPGLSGKWVFFLSNILQPIPAPDRLLVF